MVKIHGGSQRDDVVNQTAAGAGSLFFAGDNLESLRINFKNVSYL